MADELGGLLGTVVAGAVAISVIDAMHDRRHRHMKRKKMKRFEI